MQITTRKSTILSDARGGALSCLPHLAAPPDRVDERVEAAAVQIAAVRTRIDAAVRVGATDADARDVRVGVGAGGAESAAAGVVYLVAAGAQGLFSYALFRGGGWVFKERHPVWGVLFALGAMSGLWAAGDRLANGGA